jgi:competence protein ComEC
LLHHTTRPYKNALWKIQETSLDGHFSPQMADLRIALRMKMDNLQRARGLRFFNLNQHIIVWPLKILLSISDVFLVSASIQLLFFVVMILYFHRVSLISIWLNVLVVPLVGFLVPLGFLLLLSFFISPPLAFLLGRFCAWLTQCLMKLAEYFASSSWGNYRVPTPPAWLVVIYLFSLLLLLLPALKTSFRALFACLAAIALGLLLLEPFGPLTTPNLLQITFLDVRQGDSIYLQFPDNSNMLIDGGGLLGRSFGEDFSEETFDVGERVVSPFLWSLGLKSLDVMVLTHAHHDHMGGLYSILDNFQVKEMWLGQNPLTPEYLHLLKLAIGKAVVLKNFEAADRLLFHQGTIFFFNPVRGQNLSHTPSNNDSLAFRLIFGSRVFWLTGDIERKIENQIMSYNNVSLNADVLKVAHHGSRSSTTEEFLSKVNPVLAVISVAERSPFGHPHAEVLKRLRDRSVKVFRTDQDGAITIATDGNQLRVNTFLDRD